MSELLCDYGVRTADNSADVVNDVADMFDVKNRGKARATETSRSRYAASENTKDLSSMGATGEVG